MALRSAHPGLGGAIVAGTVGGLVRYQAQGMPVGTNGQQILEVLAPIIRAVAVQVTTAIRKAAGKPEPKVTVESLQEKAFKALQAALSAAPFSTYVITMDGRPVLVSMIVAKNGVLTHGSVVNLDGAIHRTAEVLHAHCRTAAVRWKAETDLLEAVKAKAAEARDSIGGETSMSEDAMLRGEVKALDWVAALIEDPETLEPAGVH